MPLLPAMRMYHAQPPRRGQGHHSSWGSRLQGFSFGLILALSLLPQRAIAHGAVITYRQTPAIELEATFDTGEPMAAAQVIIYAPNQPSEPWLRGTTDAEGRFTFQPDRAQPGTWEVVVRKAGHGDILEIPLNQATLGGAGTTQNLPLWQRVVGSGVVLTGLIGTALFFARRKR